ncbi:hypothetical protein NQ317_009544, partial [Molorchus minor]
MTSSRLIIFMVKRIIESTLLFNKQSSDPTILQQPSCGATFGQDSSRICVPNTTIRHQETSSKGAQGFTISGGKRLIVAEKFARIQRPPGEVNVVAERYSAPALLRSDIDLDSQRVATQGQSADRTKADALNRVDEFVSQHLDVSFKNELLVRKESYMDTYKQYLDVQDKIEETTVCAEQERVSIENKYFATLAAITSILENKDVPISSIANSVNVPTSVVDSKSIKLPNVQIPTFTGKFEEWHSFVDLFTSMIHDNKDLSNVQRFYYLKGYLQGEPLSLINELRLTSENYTAAWDTLKKRFDNKLAIVDSHISAIVNAPVITKGTSNNLREFLTNVHQHLNSLRALELPVEKWDVILVCILTKKLDYQTHKAYELEKSKTDLPTVKNLLDILELHCVALEALSPAVPKQKTTQRASMHAVSNRSESKTCNFCNNSNHIIYHCSRFKNLNFDQRREFIGHALNQCSSIGCKVCKRKHHTLLHIPTAIGEQTENPTTSNAVLPSNTQPIQNTAVLPSNTQADNALPSNALRNVTALHTQLNNESQILLATASINVVGADGSLVSARALLDGGSQVSFITTRLFKRLNLPSYKQNLQILGLSSNSLQIDRLVEVVIQSRTTNFNDKLTCAILDRITVDLPHCSVNTRELKIPSNLRLADPEYHLTAPIDILIGDDLFYDIMLPNTVILGTNLPILQHTKLGYVVSGRVPTYCSHLATRASCAATSNTVDDMIARFWKLEEVSSKNTKEFAKSTQERLCEQLFNTHTTLSNSKYTVRLPLIQEDARTLLGGSFNTAVRRFYSLEKRLQKDEQLYNDYKKFILEYSLIELKNQLIDLLALAGFKLHKWASNHPNILQGKNASFLSSTDIHIVDSDISINTLGLSWNPSHDTFQFKSLTELQPLHCTKRNILSFISKIFDPLGLVGPVVVQSKILLQQIWARKLNWDDPLPQDLLKQWQDFQRGLISTKPITIPRWLFTEGSVASVELHAFSDASIKAYGTGPKWLSQPDTTFIQTESLGTDVALPEQRKVTFHSSIDSSIDFSRFSNFTRLERAVAFCLRFINNAQPASTKLKGPLTYLETSIAHDTIIKIIQHQVFSKEIELLSTKSELTKGSIQTLHPFIDKKGLLRISSRLENANVSYDQRYPLILPRDHHQCTLLQQQFWKRWRLAYLNQLQNRPKWCKARPNISENSLVLLKDDNVPPLEWPLARVIKVIPGNDGKVRVAQVKTKSGIYTRPITKLSVLPF